MARLQPQGQTLVKLILVLVNSARHSTFTSRSLVVEVGLVFKRDSSKRIKTGLTAKEFQSEALWKEDHRQDKIKLTNDLITISVKPPMRKTPVILRQMGLSKGKYLGFICLRCQAAMKPSLCNQNKKSIIYRGI